MVNTPTKEIHEKRDAKKHNAQMFTSVIKTVI